MNKIYASILVGLFSFGGQIANAACEDGQSMAEDAALEEAGDPRACQVKNSYFVEPENNLETWHVEVKCEDQVFGGNVYAVSLEEYEDAVCGVKEVKFLMALE